MIDDFHDEIAHHLYCVAVMTGDFESLENTLLKMCEKNSHLFGLVLRSMLMNFADVEDIFSEDFRHRFLKES